MKRILIFNLLKFEKKIYGFTMVRGDILQELCLGQQGCSLKKGNIPRSNLTTISNEPHSFPGTKTGHDPSIREESCCLHYVR